MPLRLPPFAPSPVPPPASTPGAPQTPIYELLPLLWPNPANSSSTSLNANATASTSPCPGTCSPSEVHSSASSIKSAAEANNNNNNNNNTNNVGSGSLSGGGDVSDVKGTAANGLVSQRRCTHALSHPGFQACRHCHITATLTLTQNIDTHYAAIIQECQVRLAALVQHAADKKKKTYPLIKVSEHVGWGDDGDDKDNGNACVPSSSVATTTAAAATGLPQTSYCPFPPQLDEPQTPTLSKDSWDLPRPTNDTDNANANDAWNWTAVQEPAIQHRADGDLMFLGLAGKIKEMERKIERVEAERDERVVREWRKFFRGEDSR
ncbi:MAG: hypothetical protein M1819_003058 [Sarea resinae]|nr:MAG: hypothetical protein M1819_003058 [Sarea resinae]